jgi:hypothetical protein
MDGHVVFGGYDAAKIREPGLTLKKSNADQGCLTNLTVSVLDISVDINGGALSLVGNLTGSSI